MKTDKIQRRKVGTAGSFQNQMMGNNSTEPKVGEGATILMYSDRHAYEVTEVSPGGLECVIRKVKAINIGSGYGDELYRYESDPEGHEVRLRYLEKKQCWAKVYRVRRLQKSILKKLQYKYGVWRWSDGLLPEYGVTLDNISMDEDDPAYNHASGLIQYKDIPGLTKVYEEFSKVSVIFGMMEEYRDPHF